MLETSVTRSSDKPTCILGSNLDVDVEACGMLSDESDQPLLHALRKHFQLICCRTRSDCQRSQRLTEIMERKVWLPR